MIIAGEDDQLVLNVDAYNWKNKYPIIMSRLVIAPETGHDIFNSRGSSFSIDIILRAISDIDN